MLKTFIAKAVGRFSMFKPKVMICIPAGVTSVEQRAVRDAAMQAGAQAAYLIREPLAAAIGARVPVDSPTGSMVVDIGGGTTEVAVIALNGIVVSNSVRVGGDKLDQAISSYIKRKYNLLIGDRTAEDLKINLGSALPLDPSEELSMEVRGRDQVAGLPRTIEVRTNEVVEAIAEPLEQIVGAVRQVLERTPPELASDIIDRGMVMTGGGALLRHIDELLTQVTGIPCFVADNPLACVAIGTGMALENFEVLRDSFDD
jgi:rod shape-determining protein MreB